MRKRTVALTLALGMFAFSGGAAFAHEPYFDDGGCGGTISCSSEMVGDVIALPFRVVADVVDFIF